MTIQEAQNSRKGCYLFLVALSSFLLPSCPFSRNIYWASTKWDVILSVIETRHTWSLTWWSIQVCKQQKHIDRLWLVMWRTMGLEPAWDKDSQGRPLWGKEFKPRFLSLSTTDILGQTFLCFGDYLACCRMFGSIPGLCPLDANKLHLPPPFVRTKTQMTPDIIKCPLGPKLLLIENRWLKRRFEIWGTHQKRIALGVFEAIVKHLYFILSRKKSLFSIMGDIIYSEFWKASLGCGVKGGLTRAAEKVMAVKRGCCRSCLPNTQERMAA